MLTKMVNGSSVVMSDEEEAAIRAEWSQNAEAKATYDATLAYKDKREKAYPKLGDQLDSVYKGFSAMKAAGVTIGAEADAWLSALTAIKEQYPKPS